MNVRNEVPEAANGSRKAPQQKCRIFHQQRHPLSGPLPLSWLLAFRGFNWMPKYHTTQDDKQRESSGETKYIPPSVLLQDHLLKAGERQGADVATARCYAGGEGATLVEVTPDHDQRRQVGQARAEAEHSAIREVKHVQALHEGAA